MDEKLTEPVIVSADLQQVDPLTLQGEDQIRWVQRRLLELGYTDGGPADGSLNLKTQGTILDFRNRNGLELAPGIDNSLISMLIKGPSIELPVAQVTAETPQIAPRVEAVKQVWYARWWAKALGWPSAIITLVSGVLNNFGEAVGLLQPVRTFIEGQLTTLNPLTLTMVFGLIATAIAFLMWLKARNAEKLLEAGYRAGTVKNDVDAAKEVGP